MLTDIIGHAISTDFPRGENEFHGAVSAVRCFSGWVMLVLRCVHKQKRGKRREEEKIF